MTATSAISDSLNFSMDDNYLKTVFWTMIVLYTLAVIGVWENFAKPVFGLIFKYLWPLVLAGFGLVK